MEKYRTNPVASLIIPTYNRAQLLEFTLNSIANQSVKKDLIEIIVIDDGSADNTKSVIKKFEKEFSLKYFFQKDQGNRTARARNLGIRNSLGNLLIFIDSGMLLGSCCVEEHLNTHKNHTSPVAVIGYAYCFIDYYRHPNPEVFRIINPKKPDETLQYFKTQKKHLDLRENCYVKYNDELDKLPAPWVFFWTCNCSVNKKISEDVGLFDENFDQTWGFEDIDLAYRLDQRDIQFVLNRDAEAIHYPHERSNIEFQNWSQKRNKNYFHKKYNSPITKLYLETELLEFNDYLLERKALVR